MFTIEGNIVNIDKTFRGRIEIDQDSGLIVKVSEPTGQADLVLQDELIFPGFVDLHVHAREDASHTQDYKEDFVSAGLAAINGGVVAFADMPNNLVPPVDDESYRAKAELAKKSAVEVLLYAALGPNTKPLSKKAPYKVYMGQSVGELFFNNREDLEATLQNYQNQCISFHCEDPEILSRSQTKATHAERRPKQAEVSAIDFALKMVEKYNLTGKICHCSTAEGLEKIIAAKKCGVKVTVEVTPHHLYFDTSMYRSGMQKMLQVNPPLREAKDRSALVEALRDGTIDHLATDHAPHTIAEKENGVSGLPHLDTYGPFITWLMKERQFTPQEIARVCSVNPGQFISQFLNIPYGKIESGYAGSLSVIDMNRPITIDKFMLKTKAGWSPFEGVTFPGSVKCTIIKGKVYKV